MSHMSAIPFLDRPTDTNTSQIADVGSLRLFKHETAGMQVYRMVFNNTGSTLVAGRLVTFASGSSVNAELAAASSPVVKVAGVTVVDIPDQNYAWVCCAGVVTATANDAVNAGDPITSAGAAALAGRIDDTAPAGIEHCLVGVAVTAAGAAGNSLTIRLQGLM